jgi:hypothetical protein
MTYPESCRHWLRANGYAYVADLIDEIMEEWRSAGKRTRRDWWVILAGNKKGLGRVVAGRAFPVLPEAIQRQTPHAGPLGETVLVVRISNRWPRLAP